MVKRLLYAVSRRGLQDVASYFLDLIKKQWFDGAFVTAHDWNNMRKDQMPAVIEALGFIVVYCADPILTHQPRRPVLNQPLFDATGVMVILQK